MLFAVFAGVLEFEAGREREVELDRRQLPEATEHVDEFDVDLGTVEGGLAWDFAVRNALAPKGGFEGGDGRFPILARADVVGGLGGIPGGELDFEVGEAEGGEDGLGELDAGYDLVFDLAGGAEDVGVVLGEAADAEQAVHGSRALIPVHVAEFGVALRQVAVGFWRIFIDEDVARAVHRLEAVLRVVERHGRVHVLVVIAFMTADFPKFAAHDVGRVDELIAAADALVAHPVFHDLADEAAPGVPEDEAGPGDFLDAEKV